MGSPQSSLHSTLDSKQECIHTLNGLSILLDDVHLPQSAQNLMKSVKKLNLHSIKTDRNDMRSILQDCQQLIHLGIPYCASIVD